jgi:hypothetical protein
MLTTPYVSTPPQENGSLAERTWEEFRPFLSRYQWAFDDPSHSPRAVEIASAIRNRGRKGACTFWRPEGYKYLLPVLHSRRFEQAVANRRKLYYVSYGSLALLYLDTDIHRAWQTVDDARQAQGLLDRLTTRFFGRPVLFSAASTLGGNDYLKVDLCGVEYHTANEVFARLENALQLFLAFCGNLADFEVKGTVGYLRDGEYRWGKYGKLPTHHPDWNFARLEEFRSRPPVSIHRLNSLCQEIEAQVPPDVLERHKAYKKSRGDEPLVKDGHFLVTPAIEQAIVAEHGDVWWPCIFMDHFEDRDGNHWLAEKYYRPGQAPLTEHEWREARAEGAGRSETPQQQDDAPADGGRHEQTPAPERLAKAPAPPLKVNVKLVDLASEPDSFRRQKEALLRLARYLKRVPTPEEALTYLHDQDLFTGPWEQRQAKRRCRVRDILKFIARTFDAAKCAHGSVNVGKYDKWVSKKFPEGLIGRTRSSLDEDGHQIDGQAVHIKPAFVAAFLAVAEFGLVIDKNQDDSLPHHRAESIWQALHAKGLIAIPFCARKWAACREALVRHGIVVITDRDYHTGKAMKWALGPYFPFLGLWKGPKPPSLLGPGCFTRRSRTTEQGHNTLLHPQSEDRAVLGCPTLPRPPPGL